MLEKTGRQPVSIAFDEEVHRAHWPNKGVKHLNHSQGRPVDNYRGELHHPAVLSAVWHLARLVKIALDVDEGHGSCNEGALSPRG